MSGHVSVKIRGTHCFTFSSVSHLRPFVEKGIPDLEEDVAHNAVHKHNQEPVEGDEGEVHLVLLEVGVKPRQLLTHQVPEHTLVNLRRRKKTTGCLLRCILSLITPQSRD